MKKDYIGIIVKRFPYLRMNLAQAGMNIKAEDFVKKKLIDSLIVSVTLTITLFFFLLKTGTSLWFTLLAFPIVYAGIFLLIEISAGVPLFDAIKNVADNFEFIGKHFKDIVKRVEIGKPLEQALNEVMELTPSDNFRKLLFSVVNSLKTGADVSQSIEGIVEQISREKIIKLKEYGKKLNPIVMFYLIIAVIAPSLGVAITTLLSSFLGLSLSLTSLLGISFFIGVLQLTFITILDNLRKGL